MATINYSEAYNTGFEACEQGEPRTANPYAVGTWESDEWFDGFDAVDAVEPEESHDEEIQITCSFGEYVVTVLKKAGMRVAAEPGNCTFENREDAQRYVDRWLDLNDGMTQISDGRSV